MLHSSSSWLSGGRSYGKDTLAGKVRRCEPQVVLGWFDHHRFPVSKSSISFHCTPRQIVMVPRAGIAAVALHSRDLSYSFHFNIIAVDDMPMPANLKGHQFLAIVYDSFMAGAERGQLSSLRPWIAGEAAGNVLEIGVGTGANFPHYRAADKIVGIDLDEYMLRRARLRLQKLRLANVTLKCHTVEELPFADESFDSVVCTHVLCSVADVPTSLAEIRRVLRPEGTFRFIEHVKTSGLRGQIQNLATPLWRYIGGGCHMNRATESLIVTAGFEILELKRFESWYRLLPCIAGIAQRLRYNSAHPIEH